MILGKSLLLSVPYVFYAFPCLYCMASFVFSPSVFYFLFIYFLIYITNTHTHFVGGGVGLMFVSWIVSPYKILDIDSKFACRYVEVNMDSAAIVWPLFNSLQAFWPGLQVFYFYFLSIFFYYTLPGRSCIILNFLFWVGEELIKQYLEGFSWGH